MPDLSDQSNRPSGLAYVPRWVRVVIILFVALLFVAAAGMLAASLKIEGREAWSEPAAAIAQTASTGLLVLLILFFVERNQSREALSDLTERFFMEDLPLAFEKIDYTFPDYKKWSHDDVSPAALDTQTEIKIAHALSAYRAGYVLTVEEANIRVMVELNVKRLNVVIVLEGHDGETAKGVFGKLKDTMQGAKDAGYTIGEAFESTKRNEGRNEMLGWKRSFSHSFHRNLDLDFLYSEPERQFVAQDLAIMLRSMMSERGLISYNN